jgi:hypothetical protein
VETQQLGALEGFLVAADHDCQCPVLGTGLPAGHRRIEEGYPAGTARGVEFARHLGGSGRVVDEHRAGTHPVEGAVLPGRHFPQIVIVADAAEDVLGVERRLVGRRRGAPTAQLFDPRLRLRRIAVVDRDVVPALGKEVTGHRKAHYPEPDPRHLRHFHLPRCASSA